MHNFPYSGSQRPPTPLAVILGTNEIASAVAVNLYRSGYFVVLSHDPLPPVIRRKMAFHDVLFDDPVTIAGVEAWRADNGLEILSRFGRSKGVIITELGLLDLIVLRTLDILVDARMQKYQVTPDLRRALPMRLMESHAAWEAAEQSSSSTRRSLADGIRHLRSAPGSLRISSWTISAAKWCERRSMVY